MATRNIDSYNCRGLPNLVTNDDIDPDSSKAWAGTTHVCGRYAVVHFDQTSEWL